MSTFLLSIVCQAAALDHAGEYELSDVAMRIAEAAVKRMPRTAANPITDGADFVHNTDVAFRNWLGAGGGLGLGILQREADPTSLLATMRESLARLRGRFVDPAARITVEGRAVCVRILDTAIRTLSDYDPERARAEATARMQALPSLTLSATSSTTNVVVRVASDELRLIGDVADAKGALAYLADESLFPGGRAVYDQLVHALDTVRSVLEGSQTPTQAVANLSPQTAGAASAAPATATTGTAQQPSSAPTAAAPASASGTTATPRATPNTTNPAAWAAYYGQGYNRENHIGEYLQAARQGGWNYEQLAAHLHQHEADLAFMREVLSRFSQQGQP